ncbi:hypothetical protein C8J56DRAFT_922354 [Mycena floridula]|nr:hypothetical protein C8J56DRAFT_922354 [Mycena floridula]
MVCKSFTMRIPVHLTSCSTQKARLAARFVLIIAINALFIGSIVMLMASLLCFGAEIHEFGVHGSTTSFRMSMLIVGNCFGRVNFVISDAIVVCSLVGMGTPSKTRIQSILILCFLGSFVGVFIDFTFSTLQTLGKTGIPHSGPMSLILSLPMLLTNVLTTFLVTLKVWNIAGKSSAISILASMRVEKVLLLLVESGTIYCLVWVCIPYFLEQSR